MKTKALLNFIFLALLMAITGVANLNAQTFAVDNLMYSIHDDSVTLWGHVDGQNATGELIIPESVTYEGMSLAVTAIGQFAFYGCNGLTGSLTIPISVINIGHAAFAGCDGFTAISVNNGNPVYDSRDNCNAIIKTANNELIAGFKNTIIPNTVTSIGDDAFEICISLTNITIPNSVTFIGSLSFQGCTGLTSIIIPNSVTTIYDGAFEDCTGLTNITIPNSVTTIGDGVFAGCSGLTEISVNSENPVYDSRDNCNAIIRTSNNELIAGCMNSFIPNTVTSIVYLAFYGCSGLTDITIPASVTNISGNPFAYCSGLALISVDSENPVYDSRDNCNAIIKTADNELRSGCKNTIIPNTVTSIGYQAYMGNSELSNITIPNSVTTIGEYAFANCSGSNITLTIGNSVEYIGYGAFGDFSNVTKVEILASSPPYHEGGVFYNFNCTTLIVPCGCVQAYEYSNWHQHFTTIIDDCSDAAELESNIASIYPNPTSGIVKIEAENIKNFCIYNMLGEQLYNAPVNGDVFEYDFSNYESGVYLVRIETSKGIITKRVMVEG